jgi:uncharacterized protein (TIGR02145 family)
LSYINNHLRTFIKSSIMKRGLLSTIILFIVFSTAFQLSAQVSISSDNSPANPAAGLDLNFSNKGFLPPRLTRTQRDAISNSPDGLMVFCTDCTSNGLLQVFYNGKWHSLKFNEYPAVTNVVQNGYAYVTNTLTGSYTYSDADNDPEGSSVFKWYRSDNASGLNESVIPDANGINYTITLSDLAKYLRFSVTPVAQSGDSPGNEVKASVFQGPVTDFLCGSNITDARDGKIYHSVQIGTQCWMKENLNVGTRLTVTGVPTNNGVIEKFCYNDNEANCSVYGGLYAWDEMMNYTPGSALVPSGVKGICMTGWHVPSDPEWGILAHYVDNNVDPDFLGWTGSYGGNYLKEEGLTHWSSPSGGTNSSGFTGLPGGGHDGNVFVYETLGIWGDFWTSTENDSSNSRFWHLHWSHSDIYHWTWIKVRAISVRCIKD